MQGVDVDDQNQELAAAEWKRRFQRETKVNKELGRRLRETKRQLQEEKVRCQELTAQLLDWKRHCSCQDHQSRQNDVCERLQGEITQLKRSISETTSTTSLESSSLSSASPKGSEKNESTPESNIAEIDRQQDSEVSSLAVKDSGEELSLPESPRQVSALSLSIEEPSTDESNQIDHDSPRQSQGPSECEECSPSRPEVYDSSIESLFKYAVVLAGPTPTKPKPRPRLSFPDRLQNPDFQRARSFPEYDDSTPAQQNYSTTSDEVTLRSKNAASSSKWKTPSAGSMWLLKRQSQATQDNAVEDKTLSPLRRAATGLFSNLVPNGLRGTSSAPTTPPLPPAAPTKAKTSQAADPSPASKLLCVYPQNAGEVQELEGLLEICFPYGAEPPVSSDFSLAQLKRSLQERHRTYRSPDSTFVLTIASASNPTEVTYAICVRCPLFPDHEDQMNDKSDPASRKSTANNGPTQCCLCLLSPYPFFGLFFKVLYGIAVLWNAKRSEATEKRTRKTSEPAALLEKPLGMLDFVEVFQGVMERLKTMPIPSMGGWSRMVLSPNITKLAFHRSHKASLDVEQRHLLLEYAAPTLFGLLSVDQVLFLLGCLCCERKVLVVSDHVNIVSSCVLALITLLHPLQWAGPVITVLPPRLDELLEAPVPLIAGRVSINSAAIPKFSTLEKPMKEVIEMNMDQNALHMHDEDLITYHELKLPECDELVHELEPFSAQLFGKHQEPDFPTVRQDEACKIMCARIHRHIESICALAMAEKENSGESSPEKRSDRVSSSTSSSSSSSRGSITLLSSRRRCSAMVADYILRFQETQMFSMFAVQAQDAQNEDDAEHDDSDEEHNKESSVDVDDHGAYESCISGSIIIGDELKFR